MSDTSDSSSDESVRRKRTKAAKREAPAVPAEEARAAGESTSNSIAFAPLRTRARDKDTAADVAKKAASTEHESSAASTPAWCVPDSVQERFIQIGNKFHFPDGAEAFTHHGNRLTTLSENAIVIQSMVAIAQEAGGGAITVAGTEFFKKEAWFAASLVGLAVRGYAPTEFERERLERAIDARRGPAESEAKPAAKTAAEPNAPRQSGGTVAGRTADAGVIVGRLVDHGTSHYAHDSKQPMSYFVRVETERGDREIWGVDLERAFRQSLSTPGIGDEIVLRAVDKAAVTVLAAKHDAQGKEVGREPIDAHRNQWIVERKSFLDERRQLADIVRNPNISSADAIKRHPELEGSYLQLQMGRLLAERQYSTDEHREQFVDQLRAHLARRIEIGQPLEPVHLRGAEVRPPAPRAPERDYSPTR